MTELSSNAVRRIESSLSGMSMKETPVKTSASSTVSSRKPFQFLDANQRRVEASTGKAALVTVSSSSSGTTKSTATFEVENRHDEEELVQRDMSIFRPTGRDSDDDRTSLWTLKRANPVLDSDDEEEEIYESPSKRSRSLDWEHRLVQTLTFAFKDEQEEDSSPE